MEEFIGILLIVSPGFIVRRFKDMIVAKEEIKTDIENTVISIIYSLPILVANLIYLIYIRKITTMSQLVDKFGDLGFVLDYGILTVTTTYFFTIILIMLSKEKTREILNDIRKMAGQPERTESLNPWQDFFNSEDNMPVRIYKNQELLAEGYLKYWDINGLGDKDIVLEHPEYIEENPNCFKRIKNIYYDTRNDILIQELYFDEEFLDK